MGYSVTKRARQVKQPRGGYLNPRFFNTESLGEGMAALNPEENVSPNLIGLTVDYMTRFMSGTAIEEAFKISLIGALFLGMADKARRLSSGIKGLDDDSVINAVKLTGFDACARAGLIAYKPVEEINPDVATIQNVRTMVERSLNFLDAYGPKILDGFTMDGGYTDTVDSGDGDFITADTLWDFKVSKVSKVKVKKEATLQLLMYWRMGMHSIHPEFKQLKYLGIYNPRSNLLSRISVAEIPSNVILEVERDVIGYAS